MSALSGTVASAGYAEGPLFRMDRESVAYQSSNDPAIEARRVRDALAEAIAAIGVLIERTDEDGAAILEFQVAMLEDQALAAPAFAAIEAGADAVSAWSATLNAEVAGYEAADDSYFQARSADLRDIRDRVLRALVGAGDAMPPAGAVLCGSDLTPTQFLSIDWGKGGGIVLTQGSAASHVAMLARARGVPMLVGVGELSAANDDPVLVDAEHGRIIVLPDLAERQAFAAASDRRRAFLERARSRLTQPAITADAQNINMLVNVAEPADVEAVDIASCDGVGLMRTEFLFGHGLPDEETQLNAYRKVLEWADGKPVTIRTVDAGGDKPVAGFTVPETNPFLGLRGIRLSLSRPDIFRVQIRALLRAAVFGDLKVMFPMVSVLTEYRAAASLFADEAKALTAAGIANRMPPLGIMVEVPAVAIDPSPFAGVAFFSIGSNDLTQYVMAAGRDNGAVAALNDVRHPAVQMLIRSVVQFGRRRNIPVSLCGDAGGDPTAIPTLLQSGLRTLSVAPSQLAFAKVAVSEVDTTGGGNGKI